MSAAEDKRHGYVRLGGGHPRGRLGLHLAAQRLICRTVADDGMAPEDVERLMFGGDGMKGAHERMLCELVAEHCQGRRPRRFADVTDDDLRAVCLGLLPDLREHTRLRAQAWYPQGWEQSARWVQGPREDQRREELRELAPRIAPSEKPDKRPTCNPCNGGGLDLKALLNDEHKECGKCGGSGRIETKEHHR